MWTWINVVLEISFSGNENIHIAMTTQSDPCRALFMVTANCHRKIMWNCEYWCLCHRPLEQQHPLWHHPPRLTLFDRQHFRNARDTIKHCKASHRLREDAQHRSSCWRHYQHSKSGEERLFKMHSCCSHHAALAQCEVAEWWKVRRARASRSSTIGRMRRAVSGMRGAHSVAVTVLLCGLAQ